MAKKETATTKAQTDEAAKENQTLPPSGTEQMPEADKEASQAVQDEVSATFEKFKPAKGNLLIRNRKTGTVAELAAERAKSLAGNSPKEYELV